MKFAAIAVVLVLAACGADGPPVAAERAKPGLNVSGEVRMGVRTEL
ncbi:hypothetical protein ROE7235_00249 [Roseibaca ekhonensis]|jgi:predicted small lipoprotein YifL|uniref:Uncharacterized protein n=1 Tax=Roseinatronobacter ekhonensis TaxID=254356 RepID=A0A3B0MRE1_9RHOB|nr:hypothetical protein [Roseibaca ekhonensis]SUZ30526.1 hypothetical protein ROE7235_00249 [Roseibaca ekhonensis]